MIIARRNRKSRGKLRGRNAFILGSLFIIFIGLIIAIRFKNRETVFIFPEEREQLEQNRYDQERNAYYLIIEANGALPMRPQPSSIDNPEKPGEQYRYIPSPHSMGDLIGIQRPDDHPEFIQYLVDAKPALDIAERMLDKDYYLNQYPVVSQHRRLNLPRPASPDILFGTWLAYANAQLVYWNQVDEGIETLDTIFKILQLHSSESNYIYESRQHWNEYYYTLRSIVRNTSDADVIDKINNMLLAQPAPHQDMKQILHYRLRIIDDTLVVPEVRASLGFDSELEFADHIYLINVQNTVQFFTQQLSTLEELVQLPPTEYSTWMDVSGWPDVPYTSYLDSHFTLILMNTLSNAYYDNALAGATLLTIAIERYKSDNRKYPNTIQELIPEYMKEHPISAVSKARYVYENVGGYYTISSESIAAYDYIGNRKQGGHFRFVTDKEFPEE